MVTRLQRFIGQRVDLVGSETDEIKSWRVIARRKDQNVFRLVPPMQDSDEPEPRLRIGRGERFGLASVLMTRSSPGGPRVGLAQS